MKTNPSLFRDDTAATSIEYAAVAALISIIAVATISTIGDTVAGFFAAVQHF